ncbi:GNAT family N-acetyltransferase [Natronospora cellulosivora (SeqCode)]
MGIENKNLLNIKLESKRLILVPISMEYKDNIFKEFSKEITTYMYPAPAKEISETELFIINSIKSLKGGSNLQLVILKKDTLEFLGCAGLHNINTKTPEFGIWLKKSAHGMGYGIEAITELKKWADKNIDYKYILYPVAEKNIASRKIPESLGGKIEKEYDETGLGGNSYHCIEYRIYK